MPSGQRYKFIGSSIEISTGRGGVSPSPAITAISLTDPAVVSTGATPHGLVQADVAYLTGIVGATQFNNNLYPVGNVTTTDFQLAGQDNTAGTAWISGGTVSEVTFTEMCELTGMNKAGGGADQEEVSTICSTAKEFEQGLSDTGEATLDFNFAPMTVPQAALRDYEETGAQVAIRVTLPNSGGTGILLGTVQTSSFNGQIGQAVWRGSVSIKLSGPVFWS